MVAPKRGVWSLINSFHALLALLESDLDFIVFDMEHGHWRFDQIAIAVSLCRQKNVKSILRIPNMKQEYFQLAQDSAVDFVQIAGVSSSRDLSLIQERIQHFPNGHLGFSPWTSGGRNASLGAEFTPLISIQIENVDFLNEFINGVAMIPTQVSSIFIGRYDLSVSMGISGDVAHAQILELLKSASRRAKDSTIHIGTVSPTESDFKLVSELGMNFVSVGSDIQKLVNPTV